MSTNATKNFLRAFQELGYRPLTWPHPPSQSGGWYARTHSTSDTKSVAYLDYKPRAKAYDVFAGAFNAQAIYLVKESLDIIAKYAGPLYAPEEEGTYVLFCWITFPAGLRLGWPSRCIPDPKSREGWEASFSDLCERMLNPLWNLTSARQIATLFLDDCAPFAWKTHNVYLRSAYILSLLAVSGEELNVSLEDTARAVVKFADKRWSEGELEPMLRDLARFMWRTHQTAPGEIKFD